MEPLTTEDLLLLIGQLQAQILQLQRHIAKIQAEKVPELTGEVVSLDQ